MTAVPRKAARISKVHRITLNSFDLFVFSCLDLRFEAGRVLVGLEFSSSGFNYEKDFELEHDSNSKSEAELSWPFSSDRTGALERASRH